MSQNSIDAIMERASAALAAMDYLSCERLCLEALHAARQDEAFEVYARILMPLQECRRQRRQIAADAGVTLLAEPRRTPQQILDDHPRGCLLLVAPPYTPADESALRSLAMERGCYVEVLLMDEPAMKRAFLAGLEEQGDSALASVPADLAPAQELDALAKIVEQVGDHEIAHQRLADAARKAAREKD